MELYPRLSERQTCATSVYASLNGRNESPGYYNVGFIKGNEEQYDEEYDEIRNTQTPEKGNSHS